MLETPLLTLFPHQDTITPPSAGSVLQHLLSWLHCPFFSQWMFLIEENTAVRGIKLEPLMETNSGSNPLAAQ